MITRRVPGWQLILADLALILFLVTLSTLANETSAGTRDTSEADEFAAPIDTQIAASQALFRPTPFGPALDQWLSEQSADPRATLTVFAQHTGTDQLVIWRQARSLADNAARNGFAVRVVITQGPVSDVYASLAYDAPITAHAS